MNGKRARAIRRTYGVRHVHLVPAGWPITLRWCPKWVGGWLPNVRERIASL